MSVYQYIKRFQRGKHHRQRLLIFQHLDPRQTTVIVNQTEQIIRLLRFGNRNSLRQLMAVDINKFAYFFA